MNRDELEAVAHKAYFANPVPISDDDAFDVIDLMASFAAAQIKLAVKAERQAIARDIRHMGALKAGDDDGNYAQGFIDTKRLILAKLEDGDAK